MKQRNWLIGAAISSSLALGTTAIAQEAHHAVILGNAPEEATEQPVCLLHQYHTSIAPNRARYGAWDTIIPEADGAAEGSILGMQTVHTVLLPSGKVLMISGSSWRNLAPIQYYPEFPSPNPGTGLFARGTEPFRPSCH